MSNGVIAAIAFSSIFGILIVLACCGRFVIILRGYPAAQAIFERVVLTAAERRTSVVAVVERRNSKASESRRNSVVTPRAESSKSTLELRAVQVDTKERT